MLKNLFKIISIMLIIVLLIMIYTIGKNSSREIITYNTEIEAIDDSTYLRAIISNDSIYYLYSNHGLHRTYIDRVIYDDSSHYYRTDSTIIHNPIGNISIIVRTFYIPKNSLKL